MPVLFWRILRIGPRRIGARRFLAATPWLAVLLVSWSLGEAAGAVSGSYNPLPTKEMR
jgi:hypothetical protein